MKSFVSCAPAPSRRGGMDGDSIRTPDQRLRAFVSSTLAELAEERTAVQVGDPPPQNPRRSGHALRPDSGRETRGSRTFVKVLRAHGPPELSGTRCVRRQPYAVT
jgi:hypothetical protein